MPSTLHITNGDSAAGGIRATDPKGTVLPWRDILHEGPVPPDLSLSELSRVRANWLAAAGMGDADELRQDFADRDNVLRRFADYDEVVLWFEWDLYDQLQLLQILDFFASQSTEDLAETGTRISLICIAGYLGTLRDEDFPDLYAKRSPVTDEALQLARRAWAAFRSGDPFDLERTARGDTAALEFLSAALIRQLQELPSTLNGLSRSESQILEAVSHGPITFSEIFRRVGDREDRVFCGDATMASYIERMSLHPHPLLTYPSGESIDAPRTEEDSRAFRNADIALTDEGREVLIGNSDWISLGGSDRWIGGLRLDSRDTQWRWDPDNMIVVEQRIPSNGD